MRSFPQVKRKSKRRKRYFQNEDFDNEAETQMKGPTLAVVAKFAGVSKRTVTRVYRNDPGISKRLNKKILNIREFLLWQKSLGAKKGVSAKQGHHVTALSNPRLRDHCQTLNFDSSVNFPMRFFAIGSRRFRNPSTKGQEQAGNVPGTNNPDNPAIRFLKFCLRGRCG